MFNARNSIEVNTMDTIIIAKFDGKNRVILVPDGRDLGCHILVIIST